VSGREIERKPKGISPPMSVVLNGQPNSRMPLVEDEVGEGAGGSAPHSMELLWGYNTAFATVFVISLVLGVPLSFNK